MRKLIRKLNIKSTSTGQTCKLSIEVKVCRHSQRVKGRRKFRKQQFKLKWPITYCYEGDKVKEYEEDRKSDRSKSNDSCRTTSSEGPSSAEDESENSVAESTSLPVSSQILRLSRPSRTTGSNNKNQCNNSTDSLEEEEEPGNAEEEVDILSSNKSRSSAASTPSLKSMKSSSEALVVLGEGNHVGDVGDVGDGDGAEVGSANGGVSCCKKSTKVKSLLEVGETLADTPSDRQEQMLRRRYDESMVAAANLHGTLVDPTFSPLDMNKVRRNFKLIKRRKHPAQIYAESCRLEGLGMKRVDQILLYHLMKKSKLSLSKKESMLTDKQSPANETAVYPDWLAFKLRVKKQSGDSKWLEFVAYCKHLRSAEPVENMETGPNVQESEKYSIKYIDTWTNCVSVVGKNGASVGDIVRTAFFKLGLDDRADFRYSIGCFFGDKRSEKCSGTTKDPTEVFDATPLKELFCLNATEIFINTNKLEMYRHFPAFFDKIAAPLGKNKVAKCNT